MSNITNKISTDLVHHICYFLTKKELYSLFLTTKKFKYLKKLIIGTTLVLYDKYQIFRKCKICKHDDYKHIRRILYKNKPMYKGFLPDNIEYLKCIYGFNQPIHTGVLPAKLVHLNLGFFFNHPLNVGVLPPFLVYLNLGFVFNYIIFSTIIYTTNNFDYINVIFVLLFLSSPKYNIINSSLIVVDLYYIDLKMYIDDG